MKGAADPSIPEAASMEDGAFYGATPMPKITRSRMTFNELTMIILTPWIMFLFILRNFLYSQAEVFTWASIAILVMLSMVLFSMGTSTKSSTPLSIGFLCFISVGVSTLLGLWLNAHYLQRYWELQASNEYRNVMPLADSGLTGNDTATLYFSGDALVDTRRTLGYLANGDTYCVAPVTGRGASLSTAVHYWAIGQNCCEQRGNFDCGSARDAGPLVGVTERPNRIFLRAVAQASSIYGMTTASNAVAVSFVSDPKSLATDIWQESLIISAIAALMDLCICSIAGLILARASVSQQNPWKL